MSADVVYLLVGTALLLAVLLPTLLERYAVSAPLVLLGVGMVFGLLPLPGGVSASPVDNQLFVEHLTELCVIVALMGVGLALDRPLEWRTRQGWSRWGATWRLLGIAMPLTILGVALLGWSVMGLAPAGALLLGAALAPTDPVLASDVQVGAPTPFAEGDVDPEAPGMLEEPDEVRFALTSEAGLNDGLAFPFVYAAIFLATLGPVGEWGLRWLAWELVGKVVLGTLIGAAVGWALARLAFEARRPSLRLAEVGEPLLGLAAVLLAYGLAEVDGGYGFLAVFTCALAFRSYERGHEYHVHLHTSIERLERLLTLVVLLLLGVALTDNLLEALTWQGAVVGLALVLVVRPASGLLALRLGPGGSRGCRVGDRALTRGERWATAFFGVRGIGSLFYLAYAAGEADFDRLEELWAAVAFTIAVSVLVHGVTATPAMRRLEAAADRDGVAAP